MAGEPGFVSSWVLCVLDFFFFVPGLSLYQVIDS